MLLETVVLLKLDTGVIKTQFGKDNDARFYTDVLLWPSTISTALDALVANMENYSQVPAFRVATRYS